MSVHHLSTLHRGITCRDLSLWSRHSHPSVVDCLKLPPRVITQVFVEPRQPTQEGALIRMNAPYPLRPLLAAETAFNVRTYGAIGDGVADDTAAIQRCIDDATNATLSIVRYHPAVGVPAVVSSRAEVYLPRGHYLLTKTLVLPSFNTHASTYYMPPNLRGEARAILHMNNSVEDIVFGSQIFRWQISGLTFLGGLNQLHIGNNNTDRGQIIIADCSFDFAAGAAIRLLEPSRELQPTNVGKPPHRRGVATHALRNFCGSFSTHVVIRECVFTECVQVLVNWADWTSMDAVWITTAMAMPNDTAVIENHDRLWLSNVLGVPHEVRGAGSLQRWVDNYAFRSEGGRVSMRGFRFGGEGHGLGGVWNFAPFACDLVQSPYTHLTLCGRIPHNATSLPRSTTIVAGGALSVVDSGIDTHQAVITLVEVPNAIIVRENELRPGSSPGVPVLTLADGVDLGVPAFSLMFAMAAESWGRHLPLLRYDVDSGTNWNGPALGASLLPPEMLPFSASPRVLLSAPPTRGRWSAGAMVWAAIPTPSLGGWICNASGSPGAWTAFGFSPAGA